MELSKNHSDSVMERFIDGVKTIIRAPYKTNSCSPSIEAFSSSLGIFVNDIARNPTSFIEDVSCFSTMTWSSQQRGIDLPVV